jgi:hypothetical protein
MFMVVEWQCDRFVSVLQLSVASISPPMHHSHLLICHKHQITSETDSAIKLHIFIKLIGLFLVPAATICVNLSSLYISSHKNTFLIRGHSKGRFWYP